ncbi:MAG: dienelactone hydrolase family protein [Proteobacteria bacterium]|nr:dienelactone hydrolase family protein [Pseudomonadota bacterium]
MRGRARRLGCTWLAVVLAALSTEPARAADYERVRFASHDRARTAIEAHLALPSTPGPHPAIVMMHGCGGLVDSKRRPTSRYRQWTDVLTRAGYAAVMVDSYTPRGFPESCTQARPIRSAEDRAADAMGAVDFIRHDARFDATRLALIGWSNGSRAVLTAMAETYPGAHAFRTAIAFYANCTITLPGEAAWRPYAPLQVLIGELDDWTPAAACLTLARRTRANAGAPFDVSVYPGAHHGFDTPSSPVRYRETVLNSSKPGGGYGAHVGTHDPALLRAIDDVQALLAKAFAGLPPP